MRKHALPFGLAATAAVVALAFADGYPGGLVVRGPDLVTRRMAHKIATLPDGDVLVVGGRGVGDVGLTTAELWHPSTSSWTQFDAAAEYLDDCAFIRLAGGKYLIAGGADEGDSAPQTNAASIFNPVTKAFTSTSSMTYRRSQCSGAQLAGGAVLIVGGRYGGGGSALYGEIYSTATMSFSHTTHEMYVERAAPIVIPCDDGTALVVGGYPPSGGAGIATVESYELVANEFTVVADQTIPGDAGWIIQPSTYAPRAIDDQRTPDGKFLLLAYRQSGGAYEQALVTIDPSTKEFALFATNPALPLDTMFAFEQHPVIDLAKGRAYLLGQASGTTADFAVYSVDLATHAVTVPTGTYHVPMTYYPIFAGSTMLADGRLFMTGGTGDATNYDAIATTYFVTPGATGPVPVRQFVLPSKIVQKLNQRSPTKSTLTVTATLDTGPDAAAFDATATFSIGGLSVPFSAFAPDRKGVWRASGAGYSFAIVPGKGGSSRCTMTAVLKGANAWAVGADESVDVTLSCGTVSARGGCTLKKGAFTLGRGALPSSTSVPVSAKATLLGAGKDSFTVKWVMAPSDPPLQMSDVGFAFGPTYAKTIPGASFRKKGAVFSFTDRTNALPSMTIDTAKGFITVTGKKASLGAFVQGAQAVRFIAGPTNDPTVVDVRMALKGKTLTY